MSKRTTGYSAGQRRPAWSFQGRGGKGLGVVEPVTDEDWLRRIIGDSFGMDEALLEAGSVLAEVAEFDSLDFVELAMLVEKHFGFEFGEDFDGERLATFGDWLREVRQRSKGMVGEGSEG